MSGTWPYIRERRLPTQVVAQDAGDPLGVHPSGKKISPVEAADEDGDPLREVLVAADVD